MTTIAERPQELIDTLTRVRGFVQRSEQSINAHSTPSEMLAIIDANIQSLSDDGSYARDDLILLFAPTGSMQDTAYDSGWGNEFLALSEQFDKLVGSQ